VNIIQIQIHLFNLSQKPLQNNNQTRKKRNEIQSTEHKEYITKLAM
jgi:hypothetical protein